MNKRLNKVKDTYDEIGILLNRINKLIFEAEYYSKEEAKLAELGVDITKELLLFKDIRISFESSEFNRF